MPGAPKYKRILLKLSGESLMGSRTSGIDSEVIDYICDQIAAVRDADVDIGIVVGGGNIFRGIEAAERGTDRVTAD